MQCKDQFWIEPRTGMDPGPKSPNNKFVESGRKNQLGSRVQIFVDSVKWKELQMHTCKKHPRTCPNSMIDSEELQMHTCCKAACLLFRHHLHINAARELAGQHLMRGQQYFQIFVIPHPYPLSDIFPSPCRKVPLVRFIKGLRRPLATSDRCFEMVIILRHG